MKHLISLLAFTGLLLAQGAAAQGNCELTITANDQIQFDKEELRVPADCEEVTLTLEHVGMLPAEQMGHNWVLTRTEDWEAVAQEGQTAGLDNGYLPQDDERIIAHTELLGGGEQDSITFDVSGLDPNGDYTFFCSFPGHPPLMNGEFLLEG